MYPGQVPDLELLFFCHDTPIIWKKDFRKQEPNATWPPPPLFHYCGHREAYGIVFPDWSFWGWPEVNIKEWNKLSIAIREGNKRIKWEDREPYAYWKGNSHVSLERRNLMTCNFSDKYDPMVRLYDQDWDKEKEIGYKSSNLEDQCTHRYKIYIEGRSWSVSKKYILACDSMTLLIKPEYYDFFARSMVPLEHYWPIKSQENCGDLKFAVEWGNNNTEKAQAIGRQGSEYMMKNLDMKYVYDYMLYVLQGYGKLMKLNVTVPKNATEVCSETMACPITDGGLIRQCMDDSLVMSPSVKPACDLPPPYGDDELKRFLDKQEWSEIEVEKWASDWKVQNNIFQEKDLSNLVLEAYVYNKTSNITKSCLGKIRILGTAFVPYSEAVGLHYPLEKEKWSVFSAIRGELALKVFVTDSPSPTVLNPNLNPTKKVTSNTRHKSHNIPSTEKTKPSLRRNQHSPQQHSPQPQPQPLQLLQNQPQPLQPPPVMEPTRFQTARFGSPVASTMGFNPNLPDYSIKETNPVLGGGKGARRTGPNDLVEPMEFLFIKIVKARNLPTMDLTGGLDPYIQVKLGNFTAKTKHFEKNQNPIWNEVFAFSKSNQQSNVLEVILMDKDLIKDDFVGLIRFDLNEIPTRVAPDSPLAPEWYRVNHEKGGEVMLAVWFGTQADEAFSDATYSDALNAVNKSSVRSKIYHSPRLWYLRVNVIEAQDLVTVPDRTRFPNPYVKIQLSNQMVRTKPSQSLNPRWNEEFTLVAAEPFEDLIVSIEDRIAVNREETLGTIRIPIGTIDRRIDDNRNVPNRWFSLEFENQRRVRFATTKLLLNVCLEGGYHVLDESTYYSSDFRPSMKEQLIRQQPSIGVLELGILRVEGLNISQDGKKETVDAYCVAKYGTKWVRTRTVTDSLNPRYNEQYTWEVYEPATVITIGVFDNNQINGGNGNGNGNGNNKDGKIGKVRVRISTLESGRIYTNSYPLLVLRPSGVKKMGELHLAIRFSCTSMFQMLLQYWKPLLPKMHYARPLKVVQQEILRQHAVNLVAARLSRAEPPLRKEVIEYISDSNSHFWSMRKSRANLFRLRSVFSGLLGTGEWFQDICRWKKPVASTAVHVIYFAFVCLPEMILPIMSLCLFMFGVWNYRLRPRQPPHMDTRLSFADNIHPEELSEEFDTFPYSSQDPGIVKMRYERLRSIASRAQTVVGDIAGQGERVQALLSWRDPRATSVFMVLCLVSSVVLYVVPFKVFVLLAGIYIMRHPRFRRKTPPGLVNFFRRLPAKTDCML
ncbi:hypothetical protein AALP_AA5G269900 [Arabis alpina]|uniref:C2 domain-containing protein n=1 Tax=Arabis alpina TaxID=50452 RepID=A0A087GZM3_ARAAL|nr:hypothetical protein AALP_AA5G269900 [Arabis alpina]